MVGSTTPNYGLFAKIVSSCDSAPSPKPAACFLIKSLDDLYYDNCDSYKPGTLNPVCAAFDGAFKALADAKDGCDTKISDSNACVNTVKKVVQDIIALLPEFPVPDVAKIIGLQSIQASIEQLNTLVKTCVGEVSLTPTCYNLATLDFQWHAQCLTFTGSTYNPTCANFLDSIKTVDAACSTEVGNPALSTPGCIAAAATAVNKAPSGPPPSIETLDALNAACSASSTPPAACDQISILDDQWYATCKGFTGSTYNPECASQLTTIANIGIACSGTDIAVSLSSSSCAAATTTSKDYDGLPDPARPNVSSGGSCDSSCVQGAVIGSVLVFLLVVACIVFHHFIIFKKIPIPLPDIEAPTCHPDEPAHTQRIVATSAPDADGVAVLRTAVSA